MIWAGSPGSHRRTNDITSWWIRFGRIRFGRGRFLARRTLRMRPARIARIRFSFRMVRPMMGGSRLRVVLAWLLLLLGRGKDWVCRKHFQERFVELQIPRLRSG